VFGKAGVGITDLGSRIEDSGQVGIGRWVALSGLYLLGCRVPGVHHLRKGSDGFTPGYRTVAAPRLKAGSVNSDKQLTSLTAQSGKLAETLESGFDGVDPICSGSNSFVSDRFVYQKRFLQRSGRFGQVAESLLDQPNFAMAVVEPMG
jgi:hypothetical protein